MRADKLLKTEKEVIMAKYVLNGKNDTEKKNALSSAILDTIIAPLTEKLGADEIVRIEKPLKVGLADRVNGADVTQVKEFSGNTLIINAADADGNDVCVVIHPEICHYGDSVVNKKGAAKIALALDDVKESLGKNLKERAENAEKAQAKKDKIAAEKAAEQLEKAQKALAAAQKNAATVGETAPEEEHDSETE